MNYFAFDFVLKGKQSIQYSYLVSANLLCLVESACDEIQGGIVGGPLHVDPNVGSPRLPPTRCTLAQKLGAGAPRSSSVERHDDFFSPILDFFLQKNKKTLRLV